MAEDIKQLLPEEARLGPAMRKLAPRARAFVLALVELGGSNQTRAAIMAGYEGTPASLNVTASRLAADPRVQEALLEEATALMRGSALQAVATTVKIMSDERESGRTRLTAAARVLEYAGLQPTQEIKVTHEVTITRQQQIEEVKNTAKKLGMDPRKLLGAAGIVLDGEFEEITNDKAGDTTGLEDLLMIPEEVE